MKSFSEYLRLNELNAINEELSLLAEAEVGKASSDTKGKLHELLVGYHLNGGKHMSKHKSEGGDSPEQAHDKLKSTVHPDEYKKINDRAKSAAEDIKKKVESGGHKIHDVHWTSKPGDIEKSTGIKSTQKQDASDIVVHTKKGNQIKHHGVSLKVTDTSSHHVPASNPGSEATYGAHKILDDHKEHLKKKFPALGKLTNPKSRKEWLSHPDNSTAKEYIKKKNAETLNKMADHLHKHLTSSGHAALVHHIATHVLQTNPTPMQDQGHNHIRHTSYVVKGQNKHDSITPSTHWSHILSEPHHISVEKKGTSVVFKHKGKTFASHRMKFTSQSDPLSSVKGSGTAVG